MPELYLEHFATQACGADAGSAAFEEGPNEPKPRQTADAASKEPPLTTEE